MQAFILVLYLKISRGCSAQNGSEFMFDYDLIGDLFDSMMGSEGER